jgi:hypothetical protein
MKLKTSHFLTSSLLMAASAAACAGTYGLGGADDQLDVVSVGENVSYFAESANVFNWQTAGAGTANYSIYTNGSDYYNTNSDSEVFGVGNAAESSLYEYVLVFSNDGSQYEPVTVSWQGFSTSTSWSDSPDAYSADIADSWLIDENLDSTVFYTQAWTTSNGLTNTSDFNEGDYTFYLAPGQTDIIDSAAYNQSYSSSVPGPAALVPFLVGGIGATRRRFSRRR